MTRMLAKIDGSAAPGYEGVCDAFAAAQASDRGGAQLAVYHEGRKVIDVWVGRDVMKDRPYPGDGIQVLASATKGVAATTLHVLAQHGKLDVDAPVAEYWPEFAQNGKGAITVRDVLAHRSGLAQFRAETGFRPRDFLDWERTVRALEAMSPFWQPGSAYMYHAFTFGQLLGEIVRRVTGESIGEVDGIRLLEERTVRAAAAPQTDGLRLPNSFARLPDRHPLRFGSGYELNRSGVPMLGPGSFGHTGAGGRVAFADPDSGIAVGYVCNNMLWNYAAGPDTRWGPWLAALRHLAGTG